MTAAPVRLVVRTREIDPVEDLLRYADPGTNALAWMRRGDGLVGHGVRHVLTASGAGRAAALAQQWRELAADARIDDALDLPGTGLVALGALAFDEHSTRHSVLRIPACIVGKARGRSWVTTIDTEESISAPSLPLSAPYGPAWSATLGPGAQDAEGYQAAVRTALSAIAAGEYSKVVLARDLRGTAPANADLRRLIRALAEGYPDTWTFAVDGLIGASPETLVTVQDGRVTARVLAGTASRGADPDGDVAASAALAVSEKDLDEHQYAVQSLLAALRPHTRTLAASEQPFTLKLPNLFHLATDVDAELADGASALDLVGAVHPTAAVAGSPTSSAVLAIRDGEPFDRGRYAGPVGWIDAAGNGQWAIALRCAQFDDTDDAEEIAVTAYAGAGIVAGSDPESELLETRVKFRPIVDALA